MKKRISVFAFFSGIGILDLAFERNGYNIVFVNEFDSSFMEAYRNAREQMQIAAPLYGYHNDSAERYAKRRGKKTLIRLLCLRILRSVLRGAGMMQSSGMRC